MRTGSWINPTARDDDRIEKEGELLVAVCGVRISTTTGSLARRFVGPLFA